MMKIEITKPREWEAEAVDFFCVELEKLPRRDLLKYAEEARSFISKTMYRMELRPKRSLIRKLSIRKG